MENSSGSLSTADIDALIDTMYEHERHDPFVLYTSLGTTRILKHYYRLGKLQRAHPLPRRTLKKCYLRKRQLRVHRGKAHLRRVERAELAREDKEIKEIHVI